MRRDERGDLVIARILKGGVVDRQGNFLLRILYFTGQHSQKT